MSQKLTTTDRANLTGRIKLTNQRTNTILVSDSNHFTPNWSTSFSNHSYNLRHTNHSLLDSDDDFCLDQSLISTTLRPSFQDYSNPAAHYTIDYKMRSGDKFGQKHDLNSIGNLLTFVWKRKHSFFIQEISRLPPCIYICYFVSSTEFGS